MNRSVPSLLQNMRTKVLALEDALRNIPQVELETKHYFAQGMYCRELELKAGWTIVGKVHKAEHFFILAKGKLAVTVDDKVTVLEAPAVIVSGPGVKRAGHAIEDCVCLNIHRTDKIDLNEIEEELIEPDPLALYDASNRLKVEVLT
jgi:quercetin dioxygenase-like cupin family protein